MQVTNGLAIGFTILTAVAAMGAEQAPPKPVAHTEAGELKPTRAHNCAIAPAELLPGIEYGFRKCRVDGSCVIYLGVVIERNEDLVTIIASSMKVSKRWIYLNVLLNVGLDTSSEWKPVDHEQINIAVDDISYIWLPSDRLLQQINSGSRAESP
jgi:hypothetical protein